jgi:hypothetical protein
MLLVYVYKGSLLCTEICLCMYTSLCITYILRLDPINLVKPPLLCLSKTMPLISIGICPGFFYVQWFEVRGDCGGLLVPRARLICRHFYWWDIYLNVYEKKVKGWWSTIQPISTIRTITSHLKSLNIKETRTYADGDQRHCFGQAQQWGCRQISRALGTNSPPVIVA